MKDKQNIAVNVMLVMITFFLGMIGWNLRTLNANVEKLLIQDNVKAEQIVNIRNTVSKNTFRIEQLEQMKVPATANRYTKAEADNEHLKLKEWVNRNFQRKE